MITIETTYMSLAPIPKKINRLERFKCATEATLFINFLLRKYQLCTGKVFINNELKNTF